MDTTSAIDAPLKAQKQTRLLPQAAQLTDKIPERNGRLIALLDSFELGDAEQQRQDLATLQSGVEEARPGQRRVFGEGFNP